MRTLERNKTGFFYALYEGNKIIIDEYGNETGEYEVAYSAPMPYKANISPARGEATTRQFGDSEIYDKVIIVGDVNCEIDINSILWVDNLDPTKPHDYIVRKVAKSLNCIAYAISTVNVS